MNYVHCILLTCVLSGYNTTYKPVSRSVHGQMVQCHTYMSNSADKIWSSEIHGELITAS